MKIFRKKSLCGQPLFLLLLCTDTWRGPTVQCVQKAVGLISFLSEIEDVKTPTFDPQMGYPGENCSRCGMLWCGSQLLTL